MTIHIPAKTSSCLPASERTTNDDLAKTILLPMQRAPSMSLMALGTGVAGRRYRSATALS